MRSCFLFVFLLCIKYAFSHKWMERQLMLSDGLFIYTHKNFLQMLIDNIFSFFINCYLMFSSSFILLFFNWLERTPRIFLVVPYFIYTFQILSVLLVFNFCYSVHMIYTGFLVFFFIVPSFFFFWETATISFFFFSYSFLFWQLWRIILYLMYFSFSLASTWLIAKDPDAEKDRRQKEKRATEDEVFR